MKNLVLCSLIVIALIGKINAQTYSPIATTGYTLDAVAENTTSLANTTGVIDGSNNDMYTVFYGSLYSIVGGIPNNGSIVSGTYSYQLQPYTQNNTLYIPLSQTDSLIFTTPASYASISLLAFATEGNGNMNITIRFTDNTTQVFSNLSLFDWFNGTTSIINGFGRVNRTSGVISNTAGQPKMFNVDLNLTCANRLKLVSRVVVQNISANARICVMAASGSGMPIYSSTSTPVSCVGGNNGTAALTVTNNLPPNTYTWSTTPAQINATAFGLVAGVYSYTVMDAAGCPFSSTVAVPVSTVPLGPLLIGASSTSACPGTPITLNTSGAISYTWSNSSNSAMITVTPNATTTYSVAGINPANCYISGSITIVTYSTTPLTFTSVPGSFCENAASILLTANPPGGNFSGPGVSGGSFFPNQAGVGTSTILYTYSNINACVTTASVITTVNPLPVISFSLNPSVFCSDAPTMNLIATPVGGTFAGSGVTGSVFSPSLAGAGTFNLSYAYTDANNCSNSTITSVTVNAAPVIIISPIPSALCKNAPVVNLSAQPVGVTFSGPGVNGSVFSPTLAGVGNHVIVYSYTDAATGCSASKTTSISISACTGLSSNTPELKPIFTLYPNPSNSDVFINSGEPMEITIHNEIGQCLGKYELNQENNFNLKINDLSAGLYFATAKTNESRTTQKLVITK